MSTTGKQQKSFATGHGIICAALPRSGTASLAAALVKLGLDPVHHGLHVKDPREHYAWGQAAWCGMPYFREARLRAARPLPFYISTADALLPWTRGDWDRLIGRQRAVTDVASFFTEQLIRTYPEAKVIVVERPVDAWKASFGEVVLDRLCCGARGYVLRVLGSWAGYPALSILQDIIMGWLGAETRREAWARMEAAHAEYYAMVRREVPREQVLEFKHQDGWGPLCEFLDVPVPESPFPRVNDRAEILGALDLVTRKVVVNAAARLGRAVLWLCIVGSILVLFWPRAWGGVGVGVGVDGWAGSWGGEL